jgi:glycosyltransferase involved in cell wall biosynthesis
MIPSGMAHFRGMTVLFPMWNEQDGIHQAVAAAREACETLRSEGEIGDYEILIVDDASTDATGVIADELARREPRIRVVHHAKNRKLGGALKTGFSQARQELILYSDADLPFDMAETGKACRLMRLHPSDIVTAYRHSRTGEGLVRLLYSYVYNWLIRIALGLRVRDVNFAFKLCRRRIFDHVRLTSEGSFIDAELLARADRLGYRIIQFGVDYFPRTHGISTLSSFAVIRGMLREMVRLVPEIRRLRPLSPRVLAAPGAAADLPAAAPLAAAMRQPER